MGQKKESRPGNGNGNNYRHFKNSEKILVKCSFVGDYAALLEVYYSDAGKQYKVTSFSKDLEVLENERELKQLVGEIITACKARRAQR